MAPAGDHLRKLVTYVNFGWAAWALLGGLVFLLSRDTFGTDTTFAVFHGWMHGYEIVGASLVICGVVSLLSVCLHVLQKVAAILCGVWCGVTAIVIQFAAPTTGQGTIDAWLLLMCAFTCACRWALLVLEPYVCE